MLEKEKGDGGLIQEFQHFANRILRWNRLGNAITKEAGGQMAQ